MKFICCECKKESTWLYSKLHLEGEPICDSCWDLEFPGSRVIMVKETRRS